MNQHKIRYEVLNSHNPNGETGRIWQIDVQATAAELQEFAKSGVLIREGLFHGIELQKLQEALDRLEAQESKSRDRAKRGKDGWGFIPRHLMDKDQAFLSLLKCQPLLSIARAMMGPLVRLRGLSARISYPGEGRRQQAPWHRHLRVISNPLPPWFSQPHCIDCLIYLDDLNEDTGPVVVVPGSHNWLDCEPPLNKYEPLENEVEVQVKAGSVVLIHGNVWHRALPTLKTKRRMLILSYTPTWLRKSPHGGPNPENGLTKEFLQEAEFSEQMLLGIGGYT